jgi:DNA-binding HxlR family transcriptional regulator
VARSRTPAEEDEPRIYPLLAYQADPIRESVKRLGRKWTLLILRDMAFLKLTRFGQILRNNPGLTPRVLARRLRQMQQEGLVERVVTNEKVAYRLTTRGEDAVFILLAFLRYGIRHHSTPQAARDPETES